ncbi:putative invertase 4 [Tricladium varicosporioides]|nr:putative invertase 4 [Hymenoscyphus varicosporioides]
MMYGILLFVAAVAAQTSSSPKTSSAPTSTSTMFDMGVPTDMPVSGDYTGAWRPQVHFSPPKDFMNDPNGMFVDTNGTYHLYYQYNPTATVAGNQHWGHATSTDLYTWENQKIAIFATENSQIFSGSAVIDTNNTSGFFPNQTNGVVAIYTLNTPYAQVQEIAWSVDGGYTFEKYSRNPVLQLTPNSTQFRDPKVIRYGDSWVMVVAYAQEFVIGFFTSPDLKNWTHASNFSHHGLLGLQYECPNLVEVPVAGQEEPMWVLAISINPGAPLGGSIQEYFPGYFNGTNFTPVDSAARLADFSKDNYAGQYFYGIPPTEPQIYLGWASNWEYSQQVPTGQTEGWRSAMTIPRQVHLANVTRIGWDLIDAPYKISTVFDSPLATNSSLGNGTILVDYSNLSSRAIYFQCNVSNIPNGTYSMGTLNFTFTASSTMESVSGGFFFGGDNPFWMNRGRINGFGYTNPFFTDKFSVGNPINSNGTFMLEGVIDRSILEVFLDGGRSSGTMTFFPEGELDTIRLATDGLNAGVVVSIVVWGLTSTWESQARGGIVYGNVTNPSNSAQAMRRHS